MGLGSMSCAYQRLRLSIWLSSHPLALAGSMPCQTGHVLNHEKRAVPSDRPLT